MKPPIKYYIGAIGLLVLLISTAFVDFRVDIGTDESSLLFENVTVIDAVNGERPNFNVLIIGNKIVELGTHQIETPPGCFKIDGTGKYLIPGLWDAHVHLTFDPDLEKAMFPLFLANGITSVRDTGGLIHLVDFWRKKSRENPNSTPNVFISGPLLDGLPNVYDGSPGRPEISVGINSTEAVGAMVDSLHAVGVDFLKSYEMLTPEKFEAIISQAEKYKLSVTGHVPLSMDVVQASNLGLRSMEHLRNLELACSSNFDSLLTERRKMLQNDQNILGAKLRSKIHAAQRLYAINTFDDERASFVLKQLAKNQTWQIPTLALLNGGNNRLYQDREWRKSFNYLPTEVRLKWMEKANEAQQNESAELSIAHGNWGLSMVPRLKESNVTILAGTDTPIAFLTPGFSLHKELEMLVKGGLEPLEAIASATLLPAQYFGLEKKMGTIDENMISNLILLDANPLQDIKNTQKINSVIKNGMLHNRAALDDMLKRAAQSD